LPYILQRRKYGEGEVRLGYPIKLNPDVYSLAFVMMLKNKHITDFINVLTGKLTDGRDKSDISSENAVTTFLRKQHEGERRSSRLSE